MDIHVDIRGFWKSIYGYAMDSQLRGVSKHVQFTNHGIVEGTEKPTKYQRRPYSP